MCLQKSFLFKIFLATIHCLFAHLAVAQNLSNNEARIIQNIEARNKTSLDGVWQIIIDPLENGYYNHQRELRDKKAFFKNEKPLLPTDVVEYDFDSDYQLNVPGDWNTQMEKLYYYEGTIWYKRSFNYSKKFNSTELLYFEAANYHSIVYLNGKKLGEHKGGFTPFQFDVTNSLQEGENVLIVKVDNQRKKEGIPTLNMDWWNYGGITRSVHLIQLPNSYIADYSIQVNKSDRSFIDGWIKVQNAIKGEQAIINIPELNKNLKITIENGYAYFKIKANPELWTPTKPKLYTVSIKTINDKISDKIGFRTVETNGTKILLNGAEIFLKGICIHEESPFGLGRVTTKEECLILLNWAKELGCNFIRLAHYTHNETMIKEAEKMGFLIWEEVPVYWSIDFDNPETLENATQQLEDMIARDRNRAAVIFWSVANETKEGESRNKFLKKMIEKARNADGTRLITAAINSQKTVNESNTIAIEDQLGNYIDVIGINNYCGWYGSNPDSCKDIQWTSKYGKPMIMSEFGAEALQGLRGSSKQTWTEEYQKSVYENNIKMLENIKFLSGTTPWILKDFRSPRRHLRRIQNDYNRKGIISEQGKKKLAFYTLQSYYLSKK